MADTDSDTDTDIQQSDLQDQLEQQQAAPPTAQPASLRPTGPGVYSPATAPAPQQAIPTLASRRPKFDPRTAEPDPDATPIVFAPDEPSQPAAGKDKTSWGDYGDAIWNSTLALGKDVMGVAAAAHHAINSDPRLQSIFDDARDYLGDQMTKSVENMTPLGQKAFQATLMGYLPGRLGQDAQGNQLPTPTDVGITRWLGMTAASLIPEGLSLVLPEAVLGKVAVKLVSRLGVEVAAKTAEGTEVATRAGQVARTVGGMAGAGTSGAVQNAGQFYGDVSDEIDKASDQQLKANPYYAHLRDTGNTVDEAKTVLKQDSAKFVAAAGMAGFLGGMGVGGLLTHGAMGAGTSVLGRAAIGAGEGAATMGAQGAATAALRQGAEQQAGTRQGWDLGSIIAEGVASGAMGAGMGAVGGALHAPAEKPTSAPAPGVTTDEHAALTAALPPPEPPGGGPSTTGPRGTQGEMFPAQAEMFPGQGQMGPPGGPRQPPIAGMQPGMAPGAAQGDLLAPGTQVSQAQPTQGEMFPRPATAPPAQQPPEAAGGASPPPAASSRGGGAAPAGEAPRAVPGAPAAAQAAAATSRARMPTPEAAPAERASAGMSRGDLAAALEGMGVPRQTLNRMSADDLASRFDREQTRQPSGQPVPSTTGLGELGGAAQAIGANLRDMLWAKHQAGDTTEAGAPSNILRAAQYLKGQGAITDRTSFDRFTNDFGKAQVSGAVKTQAGFRKFLDEWVQNNAPSTAEPPVTTVVGGERSMGEREPAAAATEPVSSQGTAAPTPEAGRVGSEPPPAEASPGTKASVPFMITAAMKRDLRGRGFTDEQIRNMTPTEAHGHLSAAPEVTPEVTLEPHQQEGLQAIDAAQSAIKVPKGTPVEDLVNQAFEHARQIMREAPTEADAIAQLRTRLSEVKGRVREAYGRVLKEYTGESLRAKERPVAEAVEGTKTVEVEGKPQTVRVMAEAERPEVTEAEQIKSKPKESMRPEDIEERAAADEGEGGGQLAMELTPVERERAKTTTDIVRKFNDRLRAMDNGDETPLEAARKFDKVGEEGGPRRAGYNTLEEQLRARIARAHDEDLQKQLFAEIDQLNRNETMSRSEKTNRLRKPVNALKELGEARAQELQSYLDRLEDPVGYEAREAGQEPLRMAPGSAPTTPAGIDPRSSHAVQMALDPRLGANVERAIRVSEQHDVPFTDHDAARLLMQDPLIRTEIPMFRALATRLFKLARGVPIFTPRRAYERTHISDRQLHDFETNPTAYGHYDPAEGNQHIVVNLDSAQAHGNFAHALLHELTHSAYSHYIDNLMQNHKLHPDLLALQAMRNELEMHFRDALKTGEIKRGDRAGESIMYALSHPQELHTMLLTNPDVQAFAASRVASPGFLQEMRILGHQTRGWGNSVWRSFVDLVRKGLGLRTPLSASEYTLLDHMMRPVTDIAAHAAEYNERYLPRDPALRSAAEPLYWSMPRPSEVLDRIDPRGVGERFRSFLLQSMPGDHIVSRYQRLSEGFGRALNAWRDSVNAISRSSKQFVDDNYDRTREYTRAYNRLSDKQDLGRLMTDATLGEVRLGLGADNSHLSAEQQPLLRELQGRYDKLTPQAKELYGNVRDLYSAWYKQDRTAQLERWMRQFMPDATEAEKKTLRDAAATRGSLGKFIANLDNAPSARDIAKLHLLGFVNGDYFPLRRFGNYVVQYGDRDTPGSYGVEFFERRSEANARRKELLQQDVADVHQVGLKRTYASGELAPHHPFIDEMINRLGERGYDQHERQEIRDQINSVLLMHATAAERSRASQSYRRRGIAGASTDQGRVLAHEFLSMQGRIGHLEHGDERSLALKDAREEVRQLERSDAATPDQAVQGAQVVRELDKRTATLEDLDNPIQAAMQKANAWSFAQSLMSPSHMLTSALEAHSNAASLLGARYGYMKTSIALSRALMQIGPRTLGKGAMNTLNAVRGELKQKDWNILEVMKDRLVANGASRPGMERLVKLLVDNGLIDHTALQDMRLQAHAGLTGGTAGTAWNWFTNLNAAGAHSVDAMNKLAVAKAAFDLEFRKSGDWRKAADMAVDYTRQAMPNYQLKARISSQKGMLGPFGAPLMQFKNYGLHELSVLANLTRDAMDRSAPGQERWIAAKGLAGILASRAMLAGVLTLTADATRYIGGAYDLLTGADKPHNYQNNIRRFLTESMGPELGELVARGLPHALGIDLHRRVGLENLLEIPEMTSFGKSGAGEVLLGLATGATGENLEASWGGFTKLLQGDMSGVLGLVPRPIRDAMKGYELSQQGVTDPTGKTIMAPEKLSAGAPVAQALGFQPAGVSEFRERRNAILEARQETQAARTKLTTRYLNADPIDRPAVWSEIMQYNQDPAHHGMTITRDQLMKDLQERRKQAKSPTGLRLPAKAASTLEQAGAFANAP